MKALLLLGVPLLTSCIIATAPNDYPPIEAERPTIVEASVVPSNQRVLGVFPNEFLVPVKVIDVKQEFDWRVFIDFDPLSPRIGPFAASGRSTPGQEDTDPNNDLYGIRRVRFELAVPPDVTTCHTIQLQVGANFARTDSRSANAGDPLQRDQITWFYSPSGDLAGCPVVSPVTP